ncbi:hypothetical protein [Methanothermobacter sp. THM-2]|uniref:hypothetical protein n=1 Tax=Methanothermobacter sp. THM-2 TaxID=2606912 RepID=UPI0013651977|nr:hypothetical protein [Methanothermobacter sp. THM-2]QHN08746.1 hypothetical protein FZP68_08515 [Methanothermobacter sp. THM-2]
MRIGLIGEFDVEPDKAMRKTAFYLYEHLSRENEVLKLNPWDILSLKFRGDLRPSAVHHVSGSSLISVIILKLLNLFAGSGSVISMMKSAFSVPSLRFIKFFRKDVIVHAPLREVRFRNLDFNTISRLAIVFDADRLNPAITRGLGDE